MSQRTLEIQYSEVKVDDKIAFNHKSNTDIPSVFPGSSSQKIHLSRIAV